MVDIGTSDKITNLWPVPPSRPIEKSGLKEKHPQNKQKHKDKKSNIDKDNDGPGKNIDEFV